jgi:hypothetical protein
VAIRMQLHPGQEQIPAEWLMTVLAGFFPHAEFFPPRRVHRSPLEPRDRRRTRGQRRVRLQLGVMTSLRVRCPACDRA